MEAIALYERAFALSMEFILRYRDAKAEDFDTSVLTEAEKNMVYHSEGQIAGQRFMFADERNQPLNGEVVKLFLTITLDTSEQVQQAFAVLAQEGRVIYPLHSTTYSSCVGSLIDKFGFRWGIMTE